MLLSDSSKHLGIVMPLANEEAVIDDLFARILKQVPQKTKIFCVLDKVSKDRTLERIQEWEKKDSRIVLVWAPENKCVVDAYFRGYKEALKNECDWILEMDGGLSHKPEEIPQFLNAMEQGFDFVGGSRFIKGGKYINPRIRYLISLFGTWLTNILVGTKMKDMTSGFECFTKEALEYVIKEGVKSRAHFFQTEIRAMMHNFNWTEVPITYKNPSSNVGSSSLKEAFKNLWDLRKKKIRQSSLVDNRLIGAGFLLFALSCVIVFFTLLFGSMRDVVLRFVHDDAFYYLQIARNWYNLGFSTFDGINLTNGYHPLLQWLLIIPSKFFSSMEIFMRVLSALEVIFIFFAGVFIYKTLRKSGNKSASLVWYWIAGSLVFATIYGMESPLMMLIFAGLIYFLPKTQSNLNLKRAILCGLLSGLLFLSRIDTLIWIGALDVIIIGLFIKFKDIRKDFLRPLIIFLLTQTAIISSYFIYNIIFWGHILTVSAMVKAGRTSLFSLDVPISLLFLLAIFITLLGLVILIHFILVYFRKTQRIQILKLTLPAWLCLANLLYMVMIFIKGGPETYNWYFVPVVFSGAIIFPYFIENYNMPVLNSRSLMFCLTTIFCIFLLFITVYGKVSQPSGFVGAYNRALDLSKFSEGSIIFASGDCGILGTISNQHCLNLDGLTNSFEFQEALRDDRLADWLKNASLNAFIGLKDNEPLKTTTLKALPGIYGIGRKVQLELSPWQSMEQESLKTISLYKIDSISYYSQSVLGN